MKKHLMGIAMLVMVFTACKKELNPTLKDENILALEQGNNDPSMNDEEAPYVPGELIVQFNQNVTKSQKDKAFEKIKGQVKKNVHTKVMEALGDKEGFYLVKTDVEVNEAVKKMKADPSVDYAEPNYIFTHSAIPDDPNYTDNSLWGMSGGFGSQVNTAWLNNHTGSKSVIVGIIDEGVQINHPDLAANMWTNNRELNGIAGFDDDNNGYIDDFNGWDFVNNDNTVFDGAAGSTVDQHGTHVAGTIGGVGNNSSGVVGINWNVTMIPAKFLGTGGGSALAAASAIDYITGLKIRNQDMNIVATNNSWGGGPISYTIFNAISRAALYNILFVAAAGNNNANNNSKANYPSNYNTTQNSNYPQVKYDNVIAVAALNKDGTKASYSNYGAKTVDLGAPGTSILSTLPVNSYGSFSGTSMATPHVTGAIALYAATKGITTAGQNPANAIALKNAILDAAKNTPTKSLSRKVVTNGRLNASSY